MAGKSTISITFRLDGDSKEFKELTTDAEGLKKVLQSAIAPAENLKKSLINWSQGVQAIDAITNTIGNLSSAFSQFSDRMKSLQSANIAITQLTGKTGEEMVKLRSKVQAVSEHFGADFNETLRAANALSKGFGISMEDAMKLVQDGLVSGANAGGDFIDTVREYPRYFKEAGLSAEDFIAIATNAAQQGVFSDKGVDTIKEGNLRIREMTTATADALNGIGISAEQVQADLQAGSITTFDVMQMVAAKLNELPASSAAVGTAIADIFGGPGEDAGLEYIKTLADIQLNMDAVKAATQGTADQQERQIQMQENIKNGLSGLIDLSAIYTDVRPYVDLTAQIGMAAMGIGSLIKTVKAMNTNFTSFIRSIKVAKTVTAAFKITLSSLLISSGVGLAIWGLSEALAYFIGKSDEAADKINELKEAADIFQSTAANVKVEIDKEIQSLKSLIEANQDTSEAVAHLNNTYGNAFGTYETASEWYDVLTKKSSIYAKQVGYEAQARKLAMAIAEKEIAMEQNAEKQKSLRDSGNAEKTYRYLTHDSKGRIAIGVGHVDTKDMKEAKKEASGLKSELGELEKQLEFVQGKLDGYSKELRSSSKAAKETIVPNKPKASDYTYTPLPRSGQIKVPAMSTAVDEKASEGLIGKLEEKIAEAKERLREATSESAIEAINQEIAAYESELTRYEGLGREIGESVADGVEESHKSIKENASTLQDIGDNIQILTDQLQTATIDEAALINQQIEAWNEKADAIRNAGRETEKVSTSTEKSLQKGWGSIQGIGSSIEGITSALQGNANAWQTVTGIVDGFLGLYQGFQKVIQIIGDLTGASASHAATKGVEAVAETSASTARATASATDAATSAAVITANKLETASWKELAAAKYMAAHASIPFAGFGIAAGFVASMLAVVAAAGIPALAEGGVATGPTLAMVGEYAGASGNPEVIAPLDKLRGMLKEPAGVDFGRVEFEIKGRTLVGILNKENNITKRS